MSKIQISNKTYDDVKAVNLYDEETKKLVKFSDTSKDTVDADSLALGKTAHDASGKQIVGTGKHTATVGPRSSFGIVQNIISSETAAPMSTLKIATEEQDTE